MAKENKTVQVTKALNEDKQLATYIVLVPDEVDLHDHVYDAETVEKACISFNLFCQQSNLCHLEDTNLFDIVQSYISPVDMVLGETFVKKGTWLATIKANTPELWTDIKDGTFVGLSIGALALITDEPNND